MPDTSRHPSTQALILFGNGKLPAAQAATVSAHLENCPACRELVPAVAPALLLPPELANHPKFRIVRELGRGGMGVIYLAEHRVMEKAVAIKVINPAVLESPDVLARFHTEARAAGKLDHPNIARAFDADQAGALHFLVLEYVEGESLAQILDRRGPFAVGNACRCGIQAAQALHHAFEQGMVHRDIKPQNLMRTRKGQLKILDFGLARLRGERARGTMTQVDAFMGSPEYVSPEQATDARSADTRSDIYSLGCTLYALLSGQPPFSGRTPMQLVLAHLEEVPRPLRELRKDVPPALSAVLARMLAKDPAQRYQKPADVVQALSPFAQSHNPAPREVRPVAPLASQQGTLLGGATSRMMELDREQSALPGLNKRPGRGNAPAVSRPAAGWTRRQGLAAALTVLLSLVVGVTLLVLLTREPGQSSAGASSTKPDVEHPERRYTPGGFEARKGAAARILAAAENENANAEDRAVALALEWLAAHQEPDGSWSLDHFQDNLVDKEGDKVACHCGNLGTIHNNIAATAFGVLPFLGAGLTAAGPERQVHPYSRTVENGLNYLVRTQQADGAFVLVPKDRETQPFMYAHGLATMALCEAAALMPERQKYREAAQQGIHFIVRAQHLGGGWRYQVGQLGDLSVTGWQMQALQCGRIAGLTVPRATLNKVTAYLDSVRYSDGGGYGYFTRPTKESEILDQPAMTAAGLLCREYLGAKSDEPALLKGVVRLGQRPPRLVQPLGWYYYYYATEVLHHLGGDPWKEWHPRLRDMLLATQDRTPRASKREHSQRGSWSPMYDTWGRAGGRIMHTSVGTLMLEAEYRHVPLFGYEASAK